MKSRVQWLKLGDLNSVCFFTNMKNRYSQNGMRSLTNAERITVHTAPEILE